jgi:hypothetical protein
VFALVAPGVICWVIAWIFAGVNLGTRQKYPTGAAEPPTPLQSIGNELDADAALLRRGPTLTAIGIVGAIIVVATFYRNETEKRTDPAQEAQAAVMTDVTEKKISTGSLLPASAPSISPPWSVGRTSAQTHFAALRKSRYGIDCERKRGCRYYQS